MSPTDNRYKVILVDNTEYIIEAHDKTCAMIQVIGKAIEDGKKDVILSKRGYRKTGIKSCKEY